MKIFMRDDSVDDLKISVGRGVLVGEQVARVENIQPLVFHRTHVEVVCRVDHEPIQIVLPTIGRFVPAHRSFQAIHGPGAARQIRARRINFEQHIAARRRDEMVD